MRSINPKDISISELHQYLVGTIAPRPIAFASTIDKNGIPNLAPYSFFNCMGSNPPILIFSSNRTVKGNKTKDTLHNVESTGEVVINIVSYKFIRKMALASVSYSSEINEFEKSGLTPLKSDLIKPFRVKESAAQFECKVIDIIPIGNEGGAPNIIITEIVRLHLSEHLFDNHNKIDPQKLDAVGRMGRAYYCRIKGNNIFKIFQPVNVLPIGYDQLPKHVQESTVLTANDVGILAGVEHLPTAAEIKKRIEDQVIKEIINENVEDINLKLHKYAQKLIKNGEINDAWEVLLVQKHI